jgi:PAS domain S-box-containing protein
MFCVCAETTGKVQAERALRESEARQAFRAELGERLRTLTGAREIMATAAGLLGRRLGAAQVGYAEVDAQGYAASEAEFTDGRMPNLPAGRYRLDDFGPRMADELRAGRIVAIDDVGRDERTFPPGVPAAYAALSVRAFVAVPLVKGGRLMAYLYAADPEPRAWSEADTALMREVAERTWSSVARARAEAELRESEARLSAIFAQASAGIALSDLDGRFTLVNDRYCGIVGRTREELTSGLRMQDLTLPDDLPANLAPFEALATSGPRLRHREALRAARRRDGLGAQQRDRGARAGGRRRGRARGVHRHHRAQGGRGGARRERGALPQPRRQRARDGVGHGPRRGLHLSLALLVRVHRPAGGDRPRLRLAGRYPPGRQGGGGAGLSRRQRRA